MESCRAPARPSRNRQDIFVPRTRAEAFHSIVAAVRNSLLSGCRIRTTYLFIHDTRYSHSRLLEINSHSLFSRWFSESGKLVQRLFSSVMDLVDDEDTFVVVLIGISTRLLVVENTHHMYR